MITDNAKKPTGVEVRRAMARWNEESQRIRSPILRYGLSVVSVAIGLGLALALQQYRFHEVELPVLTMSIAVTTWYAGIGPSVLAIVLAVASFNYFFTEPFYSFAVTASDPPYFFIFITGPLTLACFIASARPIDNC